jgi:hypothetical protein
MKMRLALAALAAAVVGGTAVADSVDVRFVGGGAGRNVTVRLDGRRHDVFAGQMVHNFRNGTGSASSLQGDLKTFCIELTESVSKSTRSFELVDVPDAGDVAGSMSDAKAGALAALYNFADGAQFNDSASASNRNFAAAFQLAVWEIVYDYTGADSSLNITRGLLRGSNLNSGTQAFLAQMLAAIMGDQFSTNMNGLRAVINPHYQNQLVMVPLPAPLLIGLAGLALVPFVRRRFVARGA